ncbi:tM2 domain-containing protein [Acidaminococcus sp. CAG:917]|nr:tM2 domain-containing protein [Acidaminococcus sp. CAG:917]
MTNEKIAIVMSRISDKIPSQDVTMVRHALQSASDDCVVDITSLPLKSPGGCVVLSLFLGGLSIDRFYLGDVGIGIAKLLLGWLTLGIWNFIDIFLCYKKAKVINRDKILSAIA